MPRPIGLNPATGCVPPFFSLLFRTVNGKLQPKDLAKKQNNKHRLSVPGSGSAFPTRPAKRNYQTKTINTGYLCPVAEARAPRDRQMGVGLGVFCSRSLEIKTKCARNILVRAGRHGTTSQTPTSACLCELLTNKDQFIN